MTKIKDFSVEFNYTDKNYSISFIANVENYDVKKHRVLVSINNTVFETNPYKLIIQISGLDFPINPKQYELTIITYLYNYNEDKIIEAKKNNYYFQKPRRAFHLINRFVNSSPVVIGYWDRKNTIEKANLLSQPPRIKVHFTVGMFFDGTCNNRFNSERQYYRNIKNDGRVYTSVPKVKTLNIGKEKVRIDDASSYWNPYSNIVLLHDLYETTETKINNNEICISVKEYIEGIGTARDKEDSSYGVGFGEGETGIIGKVREGCQQLSVSIAKILKNNSNYEIASLKFDVFGFSRGAAAARHFCNDVVGKDAISIAKSKKNNTQKGGSLKTYNLGFLGVFLQVQKVQNSIVEVDNKHFVKIRFLGIFDTVVSQMIVKNHFGKKLDMVIPGAKQFELSLPNINQNLRNLPIDYIFHITAKNEFRENFALTKIDTKGLEYEMYGVHSDIGGGYAATKEEIKIIDFEDNFVLNFNIERLEKLKKWYLENGFYINNSNGSKIEIIPVKIKVSNILPWNNRVLYHLKSTRKLIPRYSIVSMNAMKNIATVCGIPFNLSYNDLPHYFEYKTHIDLEIYNKYILYKTEMTFRKLYGLDLKTKTEKVDKLKDEVLSKIKNSFLHLSSNYDSSVFFEKKGEDSVGIKVLDNLTFPNAPRYQDNNRNCYEREM